MRQDGLKTAITSNACVHDSSSKHNTYKSVPLQEANEAEDVTIDYCTVYELRRKF